MQIKGKGLMVTYWLLGEELTRLENSLEAGMQFPSQCGRSTKRSPFHKELITENSAVLKKAQNTFNIKWRWLPVALGVIIFG